MIIFPHLSSEQCKDATKSISNSYHSYFLHSETNYGIILADRLIVPYGTVKHNDHICFAYGNPVLTEQALSQPPQRDWLQSFFFQNIM